MSDLPPQAVPPLPPLPGSAPPVPPPPLSPGAPPEPGNAAQLPWGTVLATCVAGLVSGIASAGLNVAHPASGGRAWPARKAGDVSSGLLIGLAVVLADRVAPRAPRALRWGVALAVSALIPSPMAIYAYHSALRSLVAGGAVGCVVRAVLGVTLGLVARAGGSVRWRLAAVGAGVAGVTQAVLAALFLSMWFRTMGSGVKVSGAPLAGLLHSALSVMVAFALTGLAIGLSLDRVRQGQAEGRTGDLT